MRFSRLSLSVIAGTVAVLVLIVPATPSAAPYCDPRVNWNCYKTWCEAQGGRMYNDTRGTGCDMPRRAPSSGGSSGGARGQALGHALGEAMAPMFHELGRQIGCAIVGGCDDFSADYNEQNRQQAELARQREEQARHRDALERTRREQFETAKHRMLGELPRQTVLAPRDVDSSLRALEATGSLGGREVIPDEATRGGGLRPRPLEIRRDGTGLERLACANVLMEQAVQAPTREAAAALSHQASQILEGAPIPGSLACPMPRAPGNVVGVETPDSAAAATLRKQTLLYTTLFTRSAQQSADHDVARAAVREQEAVVKQDTQRVREATEAIERLQPPAEGDDERARALAEARAALRDADRALADATKTLVEKKQTESELQKNLERLATLADEAKNSPERHDAILKDLGTAGAETSR